MTIQIEYETEKQLEIPYEQIVRDIIPAVLEYENCPYEAEVNLLFTDNEAIREMNRDYRQVDAPTDVLSFPNLEKSYFQKLTEFDGERNPDDGILFLGDIVICKKVAKKQAKDYRHGAKREICFLALHGLLHLLGFDHIKEEEERLMKAASEDTLQAFGVSR